MMAPDSQIAKSPLWWSMSVGMRPFGLYWVYAGALCSPLSNSRKMVWKERPSSSSTMATFLLGGM